LIKKFKGQTSSSRGGIASVEVNDYDIEGRLPDLEETEELTSNLPETDEVPLPVEYEKEQDDSDETAVADPRDQDPTSNLLDSLFNTLSPDSSVPKGGGKSPSKRKNKKIQGLVGLQTSESFPDELTSSRNLDEQPPLIPSGLVEEFSAHHHMIHDLSDHSASNLLSNRYHRKSQYNPGNIDLPFSPHPTHSGFLNTSSDEEAELERNNGGSEPSPPEMDKVYDLSDYGTDDDPNLLAELEERDQNDGNQNEEYEMYDDSSEKMAATHDSDEDQNNDRFLNKEPEIIDLSDVSEGIITELDHEILSGNDIQSNLTDDEYPYSHFQPPLRNHPAASNLLDNNSVSDISDIFPSKQKTTGSSKSHKKKSSPKKASQLSIVKPKPKELRIDVEEKDDDDVEEAANNSFNAELNDVLYELHENINELHPFSPVSPPSPFPLDKSITNEEIRYLLAFLISLF
jgi:hypothetical protein